jgi:hypothetical protein
MGLGPLPQYMQIIAALRHVCAANAESCGDGEGASKAAIPLRGFPLAGLGISD